MKLWRLVGFFGAATVSEAQVLTYATYLGGSAVDVPHAVAVDAKGNLYVAGETFSPDFPVTPGAFQQKHGGVPGTSYSFLFPGPLADAFVTKIDASGKIVF